MGLSALPMDECARPMSPWTFGVKTPLMSMCPDVGLPDLAWVFFCFDKTNLSLRLKMTKNQ